MLTFVGVLTVQFLDPCLVTMSLKQLLCGTGFLSASAAIMPATCSRVAALQARCCAAAMVRPASSCPHEDFYMHGLLSISREHNPGGVMEATLTRLGDVEVIPPPGESKFVRPQTIMYHLDGRQRRWDMVSSHASVGIVLYHTELKSLLIVRQFRPAVYAAKWKQATEEGLPQPPLSVGFTYELCAGIIDKSKSLEVIAQEEVLEECGFDVPVEAVLPVASYVSATGISGSQHVMFWASVDESMRASGGGGVADTGEAIEVLALPLKESQAFMDDASVAKSAGLLFGLMWLRSRML